MGRAFKTAVELDEYLSSQTEEERANFKPSWSVGYGDQLDTARQHSVRKAEEALGHRAEFVPHSSLAEWVRLGVLDVVLKWFNNQALTCIHRPHPDRPEPVYAAAWKPGIVVCGYCTPLLVVHGVADTICDGCGHECKGLPDDGITPFSDITGTMTYMVGACDSCLAEVQRGHRESK